MLVKQAVGVTIAALVGWFVIKFLLRAVALVFSLLTGLLWVGLLVAGVYVLYRLCGWFGRSTMCAREEPQPAAEVVD